MRGRPELHVPLRAGLSWLPDIPKP
jgi:hypothetical protein